MARRSKPWFRKSRRAWFVTINGAQHNLGPDKTEAFDRFYQLMRQPHQRKVPVQSIAALADTFLDWVQKHRSPDTFEWYRYRLERFVRKYPDLASADVKPFHVECWADGFSLSVTSRRNYLRSVKRCLAWAVTQGYLDKNPVAGMEIPSAGHKEVVISQAEFDRLLSFVRNRSLEDLIVVTWETGCRPQESLRVEARHVDLANQRWVIPQAESKTKRLTRVVYLSNKAMEITRRLIVAHPEGQLFRNGNGLPWTTEAVNCGFLAIRQRMGSIEMKRREEEISMEDIRAFTQKLNPIARCGGVERKKSEADLRCEAKRKLTAKRAAQLVPRYSLYALRHSWATNALQRGIDPLTVAILMGHQDPSMLSKVYQHLSLNPAHMLDQAKRAVRASG